MGKETVTPKIHKKDSISKCGASPIAPKFLSCTLTEETFVRRIVHNNPHIAKGFIGF